MQQGVDPRVRLRAALAVLDRTGFRPGSEVEFAEEDDAGRDEIDAQIEELARLQRRWSAVPAVEVGASESVELPGSG